MRISEIIEKMEKYNVPFGAGDATCDGVIMR